MDDSDPHLNLWDYAVFGLSLSISAGIGFWYYFTGGKQRSNREYLLGNSEMGIFPVSISLMASFMSAITLLGVPSENYMFGTQFIIINISYIIGTPICAFVFLPVFFNLKVTSVYEYLERRFNRLVRVSASTVFMLQMILYMGIVLYAPALALSAVTGLSKWKAIISVGLVCTVYCVSGGIKAVLWTDVFQSMLMFVAVILVAVKGCLDVGGFNEVWLRAKDGDRLQLWNFDPDPTTRHTVWTLAFGGIFIYVSLYGVNQTQIQRMRTVRTLRQAQISIILAWPLTTFLSLITSFTGIVMYAYFKDCDPILSGKIERMDQMLPYFMMRTVGSIPGLPGLFIAGIFSGSLSTVSSFVNSLAAVTLEDYIKPLRKKPMTEEREATVTKILALFFGLICVAITYLAEQMAGILQASLTIFGVVGGPLLALFTLGVCTKWCTPRAAFISFFASLAVGFWIGFGAVSQVPPTPLPLNIDGCSVVNETTWAPSSTAFTPEGNNSIFYLYRISYMYYAAFTWAFSITVAFIISILFQEDMDIDSSLLTPVLFKAKTRTDPDIALINGSEMKSNYGGDPLINAKGPVFSIET